MNERNSDKSKCEVAVQAQHNGKDKKGKGKWSGNKGKGGYQNTNGRDNQDTNSGGNQKQNNNGGKGGYNDECRSKDESNDIEAKMAKNDDDEGSMMLLVTTRYENDYQEKWYLDIGCSTHMTGRKYWFTSLKITRNNNVKFADNNSLAVQGIGDVSIKRKDGKCSVISVVLYIPGMKCNLLSIGQLLEKDYKIVMENKILNVYNTEVERNGYGTIGWGT
ncbi:hypothetical protein A2U01_0023762 [Trifolium medium]|uniref:Retrovirus-related Pol polyprotein from transposon TNT 1-94-like beta-barrel domain-containing protein n=1 Tax=Trifolium medium TaxID=97028 RepID=A0A392NS76_9FABA|nr:hypothetical protein [Trifolium medium]